MPTAASWSTPTGRRHRRVPATRWPTAGSSPTPFPDLYERIAPRPTSPFAQALRLALIDAAPDVAEDPVVVVLSPGIHSETAFDQAYLASLLGFPLVESADLVVRDGKLWMRSLGTLKRVDVVLRRVDADVRRPAGPACRLAARCGRPGRGAAPRRGHRRQHPGQRDPGKPWAASLPAASWPSGCSARRRCWRPRRSTGAASTSERSHLLSHLSSLLIKSTVGGRPIVGPTLSAAQRDELAARIEAAPWQWVGQELPQFSSAPTDHCRAGCRRPASACGCSPSSQRGGYAPMIGGLGYVLAPGSRRVHR